jgi:uncharacterized protein YqjF (DUF2071 family)
MLALPRPAMLLPTIRGLIDRRILVNYRVDPDVLASLLPAPFEPKLVHGFGMVGICLIRLKQVRPAGLPKWVGIASENAAHRAAVRWNGGEGVFVWRRDSNSRFNTLVGGRLFPGVHHHAQFDVWECGEQYSVAVESDRGEMQLSVIGKLNDELDNATVFESIADASEFFESGSVGYSASHDPETFQGLELRCHNWKLHPLHVSAVRSSFFDDESRFPTGAIAFDSAFLMSGIEHEWRVRPELRDERIESLVDAAGL